MTYKEAAKWLKKQHPCISNIRRTKTKDGSNVKFWMKGGTPDARETAQTDFSYIMKNFTCLCGGPEYGLACLCGKEDKHPE